MKYPKTPLHEAAQIGGLNAPRDQVAFELARFIDFIQLHNPDADETIATMTAAICLHNLPAYFSHCPEAMQELNAIANKFSQY